MSTTPFTVKIADENPLIETHTMYGMRYPDGSVRWVIDQMVNFDHLAQGERSHSDRWDGHMRSRAHEARIPLHDYMDAHQMIKRTITVAVTAPEEV